MDDRVTAVSAAPEIPYAIIRLVSFGHFAHKRVENIRLNTINTTIILIMHHSRFLKHINFYRYKFGHPPGKPFHSNCPSIHNGYRTAWVSEPKRSYRNFPGCKEPGALTAIFSHTNYFHRNPYKILGAVLRRVPHHLLLRN